MKFVLFGRLKKQPKDQASGAGAAGVLRTPQTPSSQKPAVEERVSYLVSQGLAEPEIIKILKDEGYSFQEIDSGISNILKKRVSDEPGSEGESGTGATEDLAPMINIDDDQGSPQRIQAQITEQMDAVMEQMMEEKVSGIAAELERIDTKFEDIENKLQKLSARINEVESIDRKQDDKEEEKMQELNMKETELEPRIAGLEKAFKDIIPGLVESIRELREVVVSKRHDIEKDNLMPDMGSLGEVEKMRPEPPARTGDTNIFD